MQKHWHQEVKEGIKSIHIQESAKTNHSQGVTHFNLWVSGNMLRDTLPFKGHLTAHCVQGPFWEVKPFGEVSRTERKYDRLLRQVTATAVSILSPSLPIIIFSHNLWNSLWTNPPHTSMLNTVVTVARLHYAKHERKCVWHWMFLRGSTFFSDSVTWV